MCAVRMLAANKVTYSEFKILHESKTKSDKRSNFWIGGFLSLFGIIIFVAAVTGLIKSSSPVLPYILLLVFETGGILIIYWSFYGLRIAHFEKKVSNEQLEQNLNDLAQKDTFNILEQEENHYVLFIKPKGLTAWNKVHMFFDKENIHINSRAIDKTFFDFGVAKDLERQIAYQLNISR